MASTSTDLVGRDVYSREGVKVGQVKELVFGGEYASVRRSFFSTIVVPVGALDASGERLTIGLTSSYLDNAPKIDTKHELSSRDKVHLDSFYLRKAA